MLVVCALFAAALSPAGAGAQTLSLTESQALARLSALAAAGAERIESIDVNPFLILPEGQGAVALDALIVPRCGDKTP
ncbi:MAG: hypothetical protein IIA36_10570 [Proteobacteria bacterium]|nr:hypothetical protein [Pseudomonadota bacterium]